MKEHRFQFKNRPAGYFGSILIGLAFAAGWTPCTGPILGAVINLGLNNPNSALPYMIAYIIGFAVPFLFFLSLLESLNGFVEIVIELLK